MKNWIKIIIEIYLLLLVIGLSLMIGALMGDKFQHKNTQSILKKNFEDKNLKILDEKNIFGKYASDYDFTTYYNYVQENYKYVNETYSCSYYSFMWSLYLEKKDIEYKFVTTNNHIWVMAYDDKGYCILDLNYTMCRGMDLQNDY